MDNGDATSFESFQAHEHHAFNGKVVVVVRSLPGTSGRIVLKASGPDVAAAEVTVQAEATEDTPVNLN